MTQELEIIIGWDVYHPFAIMLWGRHHDSGSLLGGFQTRQEAVSYALAFARENDCVLPTADVLTFTKGART